MPKVLSDVETTNRKLSEASKLIARSKEIGIEIERLITERNNVLDEANSLINEAGLNIYNK
jgi:hypothetical protein